MTVSAQPRPSMPRWQRVLLPGDLVGGSAAPRSPRDWLVDVLAALFAAALGAFVLAETWSAHSPVGVAVDLALGAAAWIALWFRRTRPVAVGLLALLASSVSAIAAGPGVVALFGATVRAPRRALVLVVAVGVLSAVVFPIFYATRSGYLTDAAIGLLLTAAIVGWGLFARARRELVLSLRERADRLETEQRLMVAQAREAERRRIAGEMHDVLAHRVSLLSLHAGALEYARDAPPEEVAHSAGVIRTNAHGVLQELREVIGVLREDGADDLARPQPALAQIPALVADARAAGTRVACSIDVPEPPAALGRTAYRVVQEGLTNARKHAPGAAVEVAVAGRPGGTLTASVVSRRTRGSPDPAVPGWGAGIVGLRERVALQGGTLTHGPDARGDFVLAASLPWPA